MLNLYGEVVPVGYKMPDRISYDVIGLERDIFGRLVKVYYSPFGPMDITGRYVTRRRSLFEKLSTWMRFGCWV